MIDSLNGYQAAMPEENFLILHIHELLQYLNRQGATTFLTVAQHGLVGDMKAPVDVTYLADTVILLRYFEAVGEVRRAMSVIKKRSGGHEKTIREFEIGDEGLPWAAADQLPRRAARRAQFRRSGFGSDGRRIGMTARSAPGEVGARPDRRARRAVTPRSPARSLRGAACRCSVCADLACVLHGAGQRRRRGAGRRGGAADRRLSGAGRAGSNSNRPGLTCPSC